MHDMAVLLASAVGHLADVIARLGRDVSGDATDDADEAIKDARRVERVYRKAMSALLAEEDLRVVTGRS